MNTIYTLSMLAALGFIIVFTTKFDWKGIASNHYVTIILLGLAVRLFVSGLNVGYEVDINCFKAWSNMLAERGFGKFYASPEFTDYPPGYMYILFAIGWIRKIFGLGYASDAFNLLIKLPAILCDLATGAGIYWLASKKIKPSYAWLLALAYILNPAIIINSSAWGQVDSIYTLVMLISIYYLSAKNYRTGFLMFAAAVMIKPQSLIFSPIYIFAAFEIVKSGGYKKRYFVQVFKYFFACVGLCAVCVLPFSFYFENGLVVSFMPVITQYSSTIASYPYATLNAYNFYSLIGANWRSVDQAFLFMNYTVFGIICIVGIVAVGFYLLWRNKKRANYFFVAALINTLTFMFSTRMHERYLFPTIAFLLAAYIFMEDSEAKRRLIPLYTFFSLTLFVNCADVINMLRNGNQMIYLEKTLPPLSAANFLLTLFMIYTAINSFAPDKAQTAGDSNEEQGIKPIISEDIIENDKSETAIEPYKLYVPYKGMIRLDYALMFLLTAVYAVIAFTNLGNTSSPQTTWSAGYLESAVAEFEDVIEIDQIQFLTGAKDSQSYDIEFSETGEFEEYVYREEVYGSGVTRIKADAVFSWQTVPVAAFAKSVRITPITGKLMLQELGFKKSGRVQNVIFAESESALFDEQQLIPERTTFMNSTMFDEIYHARTAYEFIHKMDVYEWTHPPLGKVLISWGIRVFGMTPFGWRFSGALFGVLMVPFMYLFGKRLFKSTGFAFFSALLISCDFMHFSQTRISTIDTFVTFFIIGAFYFMYLYFDMEINSNNFSKSFLYLALSGLFIGCAAAAKWPGIYAAAGLAIVFFISVYRRMTKESFSVKQMLITFGLCGVFFIVIPLIIYTLSYIPYMQSPGKGSIAAVIKNQQEMFGYHAGQNSPHPYMSPWWQWPFNIRPLLFVNTGIAPGVNSAISTFGNPLVWWAGVVAFFYTLSAYSDKQGGFRDQNALYLMVAFLAQLMPWSLVTRSTYIYHYFPSVPFIILMIAYMFKKYFMKTGKHYIYIYAICVLAAFILFFPVISGMPINFSFVHKFLKWLPSWQLM